MHTTYIYSTLNRQSGSQSVEFHRCPACSNREGVGLGRDQFIHLLGFFWVDVIPIGLHSTKW